MKTLPGFGSPMASFDEPFAMLHMCHERIERTLALLQQLRTYLPKSGADEPARQAARDVLRYFDKAAPLHHEDEERHVFALLLSQGDPTTGALVRRLQDDHQCMAVEWQAARLPLLALAEGEVNCFEPRDEQVLHAFATRYAEHLRAEEGIAYPVAQALLVPAALSAMGQEMAQRRGLL